jgi:hypothetical protein
LERSNLERSKYGLAALEGKGDGSYRDVDRWAVAAGLGLRTQRGRDLAL